ncbi:hypothetical protein SKAU_G00294120 [Synaphobranchus kaupii]|uniref:Uncharacterized protein n=1 Tax=Synaphobranchus kaupii TaxID=118154 RepID=A0A9Q1EUC1_SYNKA|nr:hypothetical protein SKAU_G00294120 [Synaphobranchus kaupii]
MRLLSRWALIKNASLQPYLAVAMMLTGATNLTSPGGESLITAAHVPGCRSYFSFPLVIRTDWTRLCMKKQLESQQISSSFGDVYLSR